MPIARASKQLPTVESLKTTNPPKKKTITLHVGGGPPKQTKKKNEKAPNVLTNRIGKSGQKTVKSHGNEHSSPKALNQQKAKKLKSKKKNKKEKIKSS